MAEVVAEAAAAERPAVAVAARASSWNCTSSAPAISRPIAAIWRSSRRLPTMKYIKPAVKSVFDWERTW